MTAASSGNAGDVIYAINVMRQLRVDRVYLKAQPYPDGSDMCRSLSRLLKYNGIEAIPTAPDHPYFEYEDDIAFDYDLDRARNQPQRGINHILLSYAREFGQELIKRPWLKAPAPEMLTEFRHLQPFNLISLTDRWRDDSRFDWTGKYRQLKSEYRNNYFVGFREDWQKFCQRHGEIEYLPTEDFFSLFLLIFLAERIFCNQGPALVLAQGLGKEYWCEFKPDRYNCKLFTPNEHELWA